MLGRTFCPLGDAAALPTISIVEKFRHEFEDHLNGKPCPYEQRRDGDRMRPLLDAGLLDCRRYSRNLHAPARVAQPPAYAWLLTQTGDSVEWLIQSNSRSTAANSRPRPEPW